MTNQQGQTDQVLKVKLESKLILARWLDSHVAANGETGLEVATQFVGHGAPIKVKIKDAGGAAVGELEGEVLQNFFRARFKPGAQAAGKTLFFEAELSKHGLKGSSGGLKTGPAVEISALRWTSQGKEIKEANIGQDVDMEAAIKGVPDGAEAVFRLQARKAEHGSTAILEIPAAVEGGKAKAAWRAALPGGEQSVVVQKELDKLGKQYFQPLFLFDVACLGVVKTSGELKVISWVGFDFGPPPEPGAARTAIFELADGTEKRVTVPEDGQVKLETTMPGTIQFKGFAE